MESLNLIVNTTTNKVLNADGVTALRSISLIQGETYKVNLKFVGSVPAIGSFAFYLRKENSSTNLVSVTSATAQTGEYPYYFTLPVTSPTLAAALQGDTTAFHALLSWTDSGEIELIETFTAKVIRSGEDAGTPAGYVASVNDLQGAVVVAGSGAVTVTKSGQTITISGTGGDTSELEAAVDALETVVAGKADASALSAKADDSTVTAHTSNTSNPHSVTKSQVGLGNVDNTADTAKPVSTAQQTALDLKAPLASPTFTGVPVAPTASGGTNTTQVATTAFVRGETATLASASTLTAHTTNTSNPHSTTKAQLGLGNVENVGLSSWSGSSSLITVGQLVSPALQYPVIVNPDGEGIVVFDSTIGDTVNYFKLTSGGTGADATLSIEGESNTGLNIVTKGTGLLEWNGTTLATLNDLSSKAASGVTISAAGLATGGGDLSANRTITVSKASQAEAEAGTDDTKAMTPLQTANAIAALAGASFNPASPGPIGGTTADTAAFTTVTASRVNLVAITNPGSNATFTLTGGKTFTVQSSITLVSDNVTTRTLNIGSGGTLGTGAFTAAFAPNNPGAIGASTPAAGTFTVLRANTNLAVANTRTSAGTTGNQTISKGAGSVRIAAGGTSVTVTNFLVDTTTIVLACVRTNDSTAYVKNVVMASGSFTINLGAAATAETDIGWVIFTI